MKRSSRRVWNIVTVFALLFIIRVFISPPAAPGALTEGMLTDTPTPDVTSSPTPEPTSILAPEVITTPLPTPTPEPTATPMPTPTPMQTATPEPTVTPTPFPKLYFWLLLGGL
jgi:hypothetical protein